MNYRYNCGNEVVRVWVWNDDFHTEVTVTDNKTNKSYDRSIREDENGQLYGIRWNPDERIEIGNNDLNKLHKVVAINL